MKRGDKCHEKSYVFFSLISFYDGPSYLIWKQFELLLNFLLYKKLQRDFIFLKYQVIVVMWDNKKKIFGGVVKIEILK